MPFLALGLSPALSATLQAQGFTQATPIQQAAVPAVLRGADVLGLAQTGSGKTVAFAAPLLQRLQAAEADAGHARSPRALVLVPTRELAAQVAEVLRELAQGLSQRVKIKLAFGGVSINPQLMALRGGCDVMVATPGRLLDLLDHNGLTLDGVQMLVLDEADRLLDLGFAEEWQRIQARLPARRQNLFFSATFAPAVQALAEALLHAPERIEIPAEASVAPSISQRAIQVDEARRTALLKHLLKAAGWTRALVFVATKYATEHVSDKLWKSGVKAGALHGELSQGARSGVLAALKSGEVQVLVATDVAARGLDIPELPVVVNYDLPRAAGDYTHRIGRTGRAGHVGLAVSFITAQSESHFRLIEKRQGQRVPREQIEGFEPSQVATPEQAVGGVKGKRKSKKDKLREAAAQADGLDISSGKT